MELIIVISIIIIVFVYRICNRKYQQLTEAGEEATPMDDTVIERKNPISKTATFRIAGISHHCSRGDMGVISGEMIDEPTNPYDKDAVMIMDANKTQLLGYIARDEKRSYRRIADGKARMPFVGFIEQYENEDGEMRLFGIVRTYAGDEETVTADAQCDWEYLQHAFTVRDYEKRMELLDSFKY